MGATLTLSRQNGNLLIAFTAFFIGLVSSRFWRIACFLLHRYHATDRANDVLHHQRQIVFRNSPSPESGLWTFGQLAWAWRGPARRGLVRTLPGFIFAAASLAAFIVASGFSSHISTGISDEVLIKADNCGYIDTDGVDLTDYALAIESQAQTIYAAANYAQQCYTANSTDVFNCDFFPVSRLPTALNADASCPFTSSMCRSNKDNMQLDTGYLSSHDHFGINAPPEERILFRHVMQCAPLNTVGFKNNITNNAINYTGYQYGSFINIVGGNLTFSNWTYEARGLELQYSDEGDINEGSIGHTYQVV